MDTVTAFLAIGLLLCAPTAQGSLTYRGHEYLISSSKADFISARKACFKWGGDLVSIHNQAENDFIIRHVADDFFIGLVPRVLYRNTSDAFKWTDETPVNFTYYHGEFLFVKNGECTVSFAGNSYHWWRVYCSTDKHYICKKALQDTRKGSESDAGKPPGANGVTETLTTRSVRVADGARDDGMTVAGQTTEVCSQVVVTAVAAVMSAAVVVVVVILAVLYICKQTDHLRKSLEQLSVQPSTISVEAPTPRQQGSRYIFQARECQHRARKSQLQFERERIPRPDYRKRKLPPRTNQQ